MLILKSIIFAIGVFIISASIALGKSELKVFYLTLENHVFTPRVIEIPAYQKVRIVIYNKDESAEEFDSFDLNRERVIFAKKQATIFVGPLPPGRYEYFGEFHPNSARGIVIVLELQK